MPLTTGTYANVESEIYSYLKANGYNDAVTVGILANIKSETVPDFNPESYNSNEGAYGLCQWRNARKTGLITVYGSNPSVRSQVSYILDELATTESKAASYLSNIPNTSDGAQLAAQYFAKYYERCSSSSIPGRISSSIDFWNYYTGSSAVVLTPAGDLTLPRGTSPIDINPIAVLSLASPDQLVVVNNLSLMSPDGAFLGTLTDQQTGESFIFYIPEFSESAGAKYEDIPIPGRSVDIKAYNSTTSRRVSIALDLYAGVGMYNPATAGDDPVGKLHSDMYFLKSLEYPEYNSGLVDPPHTVTISLGSAFSLVGVVQDVKIDHLKPLDLQNRSMYIKASFTVVQTATNPPGCSDIRAGSTTPVSNSGRGTDHVSIPQDANWYKEYYGGGANAHASVANTTQNAAWYRQTYGGSNL